jgi:hypothetical protein
MRAAKKSSSSSPRVAQGLDLAGEMCQMVRRRIIMKRMTMARIKTIVPSPIYMVASFGSFEGLASRTHRRAEEPSRRPPAGELLPTADARTEAVSRAPRRRGRRLASRSSVTRRGAGRAPGMTLLETASATQHVPSAHSIGAVKVGQMMRTLTPLPLWSPRATSLGWLTHWLSAPPGTGATPPGRVPTRAAESNTVRVRTPCRFEP